MFKFDQTRTWKVIQEKLDKTTNPRHRQMLTMLLQHARGEVEGDLDAVMSTLAPHPVYKGVRHGPQPEGTEEVREFYKNDIFGSGFHIFENDKHRIMVDDDTIVTEGTVRLLVWGRDLARIGMTVDDNEATYLMSSESLIVWPYDAEGRILGEESWSKPGKPLEKVADEDVPQNFKDYVASRRLNA